MATTDRGGVHAFTTQPPGRPVEPAVATKIEAKQTPPPSLPHGVSLPSDLKGFGLVVGCGGTATAEALATHTRLHVICVLTEERLVAESRERLLGKGYRTQLAVHPAGIDARLPYADYSANVVVACGDGGGAAPYGALRGSPSIHRQAILARCRQT